MDINGWIDLQNIFCLVIVIPTYQLMFVKYFTLQYNSKLVCFTDIWMPKRNSPRDHLALFSCSSYRTVCSSYSPVCSFFNQVCSSYSPQFAHRAVQFAPPSVQFAIYSVCFVNFFIRLLILLYQYFYSVNPGYFFHI